MEKEETHSQPPPSRAKRPQFIIACACCLVGASYGMSTGHSAVLLPHLQSANSSLAVDEETGSWIASIYAIAAPAGCLLGGIFMDIWGRWKLCIAGNVGMLFGWLLIAFAQDVAMLISGRVVEGFSRSLLATSVSVLVEELADPKFRGFIVCSIYTCVSFGIMAISSLGALVDWRTGSGFAAIFSLIIIIAFWFVKESPTWYVKKKRIEEAERSLQWLWGHGQHVQAKEELIDLDRRLRSGGQDEEIPSSYRDATETVRRFFVPRILKPLFIIHFFNIFQAFCGLGIFTFYTVDIISKTRKTGSEVMDDYTSTVVISIVRVILVLISSFLMLSVGRRVLALISGTLSSLFAVSLGVILALNVSENGSPIPANIEANVTFSLLVLYAATMSFGFFALPSIMIGETQSSHVRGFTCGYIYTMNDLFLGGVVKLYPWLSAHLHIHGLFFMFGISCALCSIFVYLFLPETQGLTLQQIEDYFRKPNIMWITRNKQDQENKEIEEFEGGTTHL